MSPGDWGVLSGCDVCCLLTAQWLCCLRACVTWRLRCAVWVRCVLPPYCPVTVLSQGLCHLETEVCCLGAMCAASLLRSDCVVSGLVSPGDWGVLSGCDVCCLLTAQWLCCLRACVTWRLRCAVWVRCVLPPYCAVTVLSQGLCLLETEVCCLGVMCAASLLRSDCVVSGLVSPGDWGVLSGCDVCCLLTAQWLCVVSGLVSPGDWGVLSGCDVCCLLTAPWLCCLRTCVTWRLRCAVWVRCVLPPYCPVTVLSQDLCHLETEVCCLGAMCAASLLPRDCVVSGFVSPGDWGVLSGCDVCCLLTAQWLCCLRVCVTWRLRCAVWVRCVLPPYCAVTVLSQGLCHLETEVCCLGAMCAASLLHSDCVVSGFVSPGDWGVLSGCDVCCLLTAQWLCCLSACVTWRLRCAVWVRCVLPPYCPVTVLSQGLCHLETEVCCLGAMCAASLLRSDCVVSGLVSPGDWGVLSGCDVCCLLTAPWLCCLRACVTWRLRCAVWVRCVLPPYCAVTVLSQGLCHLETEVCCLGAMCAASLLPRDCVVSGLVSPGDWGVLSGCDVCCLLTVQWLCCLRACVTWRLRCAVWVRCVLPPYCAVTVLSQGLCHLETEVCCLGAMCAASLLRSDCVVSGLVSPGDWGVLSGCDVCCLLTAQWLCCLRACVTWRLRCAVWVRCVLPPYCAVTVLSQGLCHLETEVCCLGAMCAASLLPRDCVVSGLVSPGDWGVLSGCDVCCLLTAPWLCCLRVCVTWRLRCAVWVRCVLPPYCAVTVLSQGLCHLETEVCCLGAMCAASLLHSDCVVSGFVSPGDWGVLSGCDVCCLLTAQWLCCLRACVTWRLRCAVWVRCVLPPYCPVTVLSQGLCHLETEVCCLGAMCAASLLRSDCVVSGLVSPGDWGVLSGCDVCCLLTAPWLCCLRACVTWRLRCAVWVRCVLPPYCTVTVLSQGLCHLETEVCCLGAMCAASLLHSDCVVSGLVSPGDWGVLSGCDVCCLLTAQWLCCLRACVTWRLRCAVWVRCVLPPYCAVTVLSQGLCHLETEVCCLGAMCAASLLRSDCVVSGLVSPGDWGVLSGCDVCCLLTAQWLCCLRACVTWRLRCAVWVRCVLPPYCAVTVLSQGLCHLETEVCCLGAMCAASWLPRDCVVSGFVSPGDWGVLSGCDVCCLLTAQWLCCLRACVTWRLRCAVWVRCVLPPYCPVTVLSQGLCHLETEVCCLGAMCAASWLRSDCVVSGLVSPGDWGVLSGCDVCCLLTAQWLCCLRACVTWRLRCAVWVRCVLPPYCAVTWCSTLVSTSHLTMLTEFSSRAFMGVLMGAGRGGPVGIYRGLSNRIVFHFSQERDSCGLSLVTVFIHLYYFIFHALLIMLHQFWFWIVFTKLINIMFFSHQNKRVHLKLICNKEWLCFIWTRSNAAPVKLKILLKADPFHHIWLFTNLCVFDA